MFILVALIVLLGASSFTAATWTHFTGEPAWAWQIVAVVLPALFVTVIFLSFRRQHILQQAAGKVTAVAVGFLNFAFAAGMACWLLLWIARAAGLAVNPAWIAWVFYGGAAVATLYGLLNGARLRVTRFTVHLPNLPEKWQGRDVVLVSDLHVGNIRGPDFVRRVVARLQQLEPAAVFIAGDMFDGAKVDVARSVAPWAAWRAPAGTYFVTGNHDEFSDPASYFAELTKVGVRVLHNEKVTVDGLQIVGVHDSGTHHPAGFREMLERAKIDPGQPSILLAHQPAHLEIPEQAGISLQLSGHTHAGQFWPWNIFVRRIYGPFAYGLNRHGTLQVVTSSGAGSWGPPLRVGTRAEIVLLRLEAEPGK